MKKISKMCISLMIALAFIMPVGSILADKPGEDEAAENKELFDDMSPYILDPVARISDATNPVTVQATNSYISNLLFQNPAGNLIYMNDQTTLPLEESYLPWFKIITTADNSKFEPEIDIYKMDCGETYCIYETSFEDNARNYMEWGQLDLDCGIAGGYYDGWAWSDARATDGDHSFKNTMYDEYKNMQEDKLYLKDTIDLTSDDFELCDGTCIEGVEVGGVKIEFDTFVAGEYAEDWFPYYDAPLDFLQLGYYSVDKNVDCPGNPEDYRFIEDTDVDGRAPVFMHSDGSLIDNELVADGPDSFIFFDTSMGLYDQANWLTDYRCIAEKIDGKPGWWHVWATIDINDLEINYPENFGIFFEWESDKERVYEGAYVDNVKISIMQEHGEKIYQSHSQDWITKDIGTYYHPFADENHHFPWTDFEAGTYKAYCKLKTDDGGYVEPIVEIRFKIADLVDCEVTSMSIEDDFTHDPIVDGGTFTYPSDAHIEFTYHNGGNIPVKDVAVTATGYELVKEVLFEDDFEGMSRWNYFYDPFPMTITTVPDWIGGGAWSGSKALYFGNPDTFHVIGGMEKNYDHTSDQSVNFMGYADSGIDMEGVDECFMDFYMLAVLPEGAQFIFGLASAYYVVGLQLLEVGPTCIKSWVGPMQPQGLYQQVDVGYQFSRLLSLGYMNDENGHATYMTDLFLRLDCSNVYKDELVPVDCFAPGEATWSGVWLDDISVKATVRGDVAWQETMVIPGPCAPCETCSDQFTWEDVPFSNYEVEVSVACEGDINPCNDAKCSSFLVLDDKEKMSKPIGVDCTDRDPEAWCISDVVGNDCANDQYALATNCDTHYIPEAVNDFVYFTQDHYPFPADLVDPGACKPIYVGDLELTEAVELVITDLFFEDFSTCPPTGWTINDGDGSGFTWECGTVAPYWSYGMFDGTFMIIDDDACGSGVDNYDDQLITPPIDCSGASDCTLSFLGEFQDMAGWGEFWIDVSTDGGMNWDNVYYETYDTTSIPVPIDISAFADGQSSVQIRFLYSDDDPGWGSGWAWGAIIDSVLVQGLAKSAAAPVAKTVAFYSSFESWTSGVPDEFAANTGWLDSLYPITPYPHTGTHWAYSWAYGDWLQTPVIDLLCNSQLSFWYCAESDYHPMDLEVYANGILVFAHYGFTHTTYAEAIVPLTAFDEGPVVIEFIGLTSDMYGQLLDTVQVDTYDCEVPPPPSEYPILNMTYQMDIGYEYEGVCNDIEHYVSIEYMYVQDNATNLFVELQDDYGYSPYVGIPPYSPWYVDCSASPCCDHDGHAKLIVYKNGVEVYNSLFDANWFDGNWCPVPPASPYVAMASDFATSVGPEDEIQVYYADPSYEFCQQSCCCENPDSMWDDESAHAWRLVLEDGTILAADGCDTCLDGTDCSCPMDGMHGPWYVDECTGCDEEECVCSDDLSQWTSLTGRLNGNAPGVCQWFSGQIVVPPGTGDDPEWLCLRIRLDTMAALYDRYQAANPGFTGWDEIPGIGAHIHQLSLDKILNTSAHPEYKWDSILYNFEDGTMDGCQGPALQNTDPAALGWWMCNVQCDDCEYDPGFSMVRDTYHGGEYWEQTGDFTFEQDFPAQFLDNYLLWETEVADCYEAYFYGEWRYMLNPGQEARIEISGDGGASWNILERVHTHKAQILGSPGSDCIDGNFWNNESFPASANGIWTAFSHDLNPYVGKDILIRARVINTGTLTVPSYDDKVDWNIGSIGVRDFRIMGKQDFIPPTAAISLSGNSIGPGMFAGPVTVTITGNDDKEVAEIHYILDGTESVVSGDTATFKVSDDGAHTVEYWAVDGVGNQGGHATATFSIDATAPTVAITAPEPGLYLFGNQLLSMSKVFIIGAFTIEATADDAQGVASVEFFLNGESLGADLEAPFGAYCAQKNMGDATIKVVAADGVGNTAEDTMSITYYKFL